MQQRIPKKIALIGPLPPPSGGMANQLKQLKQLLEQEGVEVSVVQVNAPYKPAWIEKLKAIRAFFRLIPYITNLWKVAGKVDVFHVLANSGWSWFLFAAPAIHIAAIRNTPVVLNYRGGEAQRFFGKSFPKIKKSLKYTSVVTVPSAFLQKVFADHGWQSIIVPNVVNFDRFAFATRPFPVERPTILVARNLEPIYDNATAIRAHKKLLKKFPQAHLVIAGSGPEKTMLEQMVENENLTKHVTFTGTVKNEQMAKLYNEADIMINPSLADNMPNSVLEALASGVPVVSTNVGGIPYLLQHEKTALLINPSDDQAMLNATVRILEDQALRESLIINGKNLVETFSWDKVKVTLFDTYQEVMNKKVN